MKMCSTSLTKEHKLKPQVRAWRDGSVTESSDCSSRGARFGSQYPHGGSQSSMTPFPGHLIPSSECWGLLQHVVHRHILSHTCAKNECLEPQIYTTTLLESSGVALSSHKSQIHTNTYCTS